MREASPMPNQLENNFVGIDIAAKTMHAGMISAAGEVKARRDAEHKAENIIPEITDLVAGFREAGPIKSVGVGIPGLVNRETDRVLISTWLPSIVRDDIHSELMKATGLRFELENDANAAAYGEYQAGAGRGARDLFYIGTEVASVINLLSLERIVLGGAVMEAGDVILKPIVDEAAKRSFQPCFESTQIVAAELGADGVAIGAALLARDAS